MSKVVVIGGGGFIGSHVADCLSETGHDVIIFDSMDPKWIREDQTFVEGDIMDSQKLEEVLEGSDLVFHFAGIADISLANDNPVEAVRYNILGTTNILNTCALKGVHKFIFASSLYTSSDSGGIYGTTKQACELLIEDFHQNTGLNFCILRFGSLYGKRSNHFNPIKKVILQALTEGKIVREGVGEGEEIRAYVNVEDAALASVEVAEKHVNDYFMITGSQTIKMKDLLTMINEMLGGKINITYKTKRDGGHYTVTPFSFRPKVAKKYNASLTYDLGQGILDMIHDVYDELDEGELKKAKQLISKRFD